MKSLATTLRPFLLGFALCCLFVAASDVARADEVAIAGFTNGCFGTNCTPTANSGLQQWPLGSFLYFTNSTLSGTTTDGTLALDNAPAPTGTQNLNNLGSITRSTQFFPENVPFSLLVTFTTPAGVTGGSPQQFQILLTALTTRTVDGALLLNFDNTPHLFTFAYTDAQGQQINGSFLFSINDLLAPAFSGASYALTGQITEATDATPCPEPATLLLFGIGLAGLGGKLRQRLACRQD